MEKVFSVSLVYQQVSNTKLNHKLRNITVHGKNEDEAMGAGIRLIESTEKMFSNDGWMLYLKTVADITEFLSTPTNTNS